MRVCSRSDSNGTSLVELSDALGTLDATSDWHVHRVPLPTCALPAATPLRLSDAFFELLLFFVTITELDLSHHPRDGKVSKCMSLAFDV